MTWLDHFERLKEYHAKDEVFTPVMTLRMRTCSFTVFSANIRLSLVPRRLSETDYSRKLLKRFLVLVYKISSRPRHVSNSTFWIIPRIQSTIMTKRKVNCNFLRPCII